MICFIYMEFYHFCSTDLLMCGMLASIPRRLLPKCSNELFYLLAPYNLCIMDFVTTYWTVLVTLHSSALMDLLEIFPVELHRDAPLIILIDIVYISFWPIEPYYSCFTFTCRAEFGRVFPAELHRYVPMICFTYVIWILLQPSEPWPVYIATFILKEF